MRRSDVITLRGQSAPSILCFVVLVGCARSAPSLPDASPPAPEAATLPVPPEPMAALGDFAEPPNRTPFVSKCSNLRFTLESLAPNKFGPPRVKVSIANDGPLPVSLMVPGDGSEDDERNPKIIWTVDGKVPPRGPRCGNISGLAQRDVVEIAPHESMELDHVHLPEDQTIGVHNVVIRYRKSVGRAKPPLANSVPET